MPTLMSPRRSPNPPPALRPGDVAFLLEPGELGTTYRPVEVVKVNKSTVAVRDAGGTVHRVAPEALARRSAANMPEAPASRAEEAVAAYRAATAEVERARGEVLAAAARRRAALEELSALGWSLTDIAETLGLGRSRVHQILRGEQ